MATKSEKIYAENPELYDNASQIKTGKIIALIAVILNVLMIVRWVYVVATGGFDAFQEQYDEIMRQMEEAQ